MADPFSLRRLLSRCQQAFQDKAPAAPTPVLATYGIVLKAEDLGKAPQLARAVNALLDKAIQAGEAGIAEAGIINKGQNHRGVVFDATAKMAQKVTDAFPEHIVIRQDCLVLCPTQRKGPSPRRYDGCG